MLDDPSGATPKIGPFLRPPEVLATGHSPWHEVRREALETEVRALRTKCEEYRARLQYLEEVLGSVPYGVLILNPDNLLEYANQTALEVCLKDERSAESFVTEYESVRAALTQFRHGERPDPIALDIGGSRFAVEFFTFASNSGRVGLLLKDAANGSALDSGGELDRGDLMLQLAGGIAHEISNQLFPIQGRTELVSMMLSQANGSLDPEIFKSFGVIKDQVQRISRIVEDLRNLSKPAAPKCERIDLSAVLKQVIDALAATGGKIKRFRQDDDSSLFRLRVEYAADPLLINGDAVQLHQALMNLIINAAHAVEDVGHGTVAVGTRLQNGCAVAFVQDTGPGIPGESQQKIFEPYTTGKPCGRGTGLGLSIVRKVVDAHQGQISLESKVGRGTRFEIQLPLAATP